MRLQYDSEERSIRVGSLGYSMGLLSAAFLVTFLVSTTCTLTQTVSGLSQQYPDESPRPYTAPSQMSVSDRGLPSGTPCRYQHLDEMTPAPFRQAISVPTKQDAKPPTGLKAPELLSHRSPRIRVSLVVTMSSLKSDGVIKCPLIRSSASLRYARILIRILVRLIVPLSISR